MSEDIDEIEMTRTVMFVGDYFALTTTVYLDEKLRAEGEDDDAFAERLAEEFLKGHYGWDIAAVSNEVGFVED